MQKLSLLWELTKVNIKLQHERSCLGVLWYLLGPLLLFAVLLFVFAGRLGSHIEQYPLYLLLGIVLWNFFSTATDRSMNVLQSNAGILKSLTVRKELFVLSAVFTALVSHFFELIVYTSISLWYGVMPSGIAWFLIILFVHTIFTLGLCFFLSGLFLHFRDVAQIWSIINRVWWFATPILYAATAFGPGQKFNMINPLYYAIHLSREVLIYAREPSLFMLGTFAGFAALSLVVGYSVFWFTTRHATDLL